MLNLILATDLANLIFILIAVSIGTILLVAAGSYVFVRIVAVVFNSRRDSWQSSAEELGLQVDPSTPAMYKNFSGNRRGYQVKVEHYAVSTGEMSADDHAAVEVKISSDFDFSFEITKPEMLYQIVADRISPTDDDIGHEAFDKAFRVKCSHIASLMELLNVEMLDGQSPTLLTDLMLARKRFHRIRVTERSVILGARADFGDSDVIESLIDRTIYLADRIRDARQLTV